VTFFLEFLVGSEFMSNHEQERNEKEVSFWYFCHIFLLYFVQNSHTNCTHTVLILPLVRVSAKPVVALASCKKIVLYIVFHGFTELGNNRKCIYGKCPFRQGCQLFS
jgi:hypothetical protein